MTSFFQRKKYLFFLLSGLFLLYIMFKLVVWYASALRVFEIVFLSLFLGLAPAYFFRDVLKFNHLVGWLVNSIVLGILFIPYLFIVAGWVGLNIIFVYSTWFIYFLSLIGIAFLIIYVSDEALFDYIKWNNLKWEDFFFYSVIFGYTLILTLVNFSRVNPAWDAFTFWGLDSKYIYDFNHLRSANADIFNLFRYTSYYPLYYSIIYDVYGSIVEQYANWINVLLNFLALMLVYHSVQKKDFFYKALVTSLLIITSYGAVDATKLLSMYADTLVAFNMLLYILVLTNTREYIVDVYAKRVFLLLLLALSFYFIKSPFLFLTVGLVVAWVFYDFKFLLQNWKNLFKRYDFWSPLFVFTALYWMRANYFSEILDIGSNTPVTDLFIPNTSSFYSTITYAKDMFVWLFQTSPYLSWLWVIGVISVLLVGRQFFFQKEYTYIHLISFSIFMFYCFVYILNQSSLLSGGPVRYTTIVMYLVPLMIGMLEFKFPSFIVWSTSILSFFLVINIFIKTMTPMPLYTPFKLSTGSYNVALSGYYSVARNALRVSGDDAKILIADDDAPTSSASNMFTPAIYVRYFLMHNSVGGQYSPVSMDKLYEYALSVDADYILMISYEDTLPNCAGMMDYLQNYLIRVDKSGTYEGNGCFFSKEDVFRVLYQK